MTDTFIQVLIVVIAVFGFPVVRWWMRKTDQRRREAREKLERLVNPHSYDDDDN